MVRRARQLLSRLGAQQQKQSYWTTFWLPESARPSHALEDLARVLEKIASPGPRCAGIEWWIGRAHTNRIPVDFHFDQDVKAKRGFRHPLISSVFFFNSVRGGQLAITDQRPGPHGEPEPEQANEMIAIAPRRNRYTFFSGDRFHGVLDANGRVPDRSMPGASGRLRLTLVVNFWERRPTDVPQWNQSRAYPALR